MDKVAVHTVVEAAVHTVVEAAVHTVVEAAVHTGVPIVLVVVVVVARTSPARARTVQEEEVGDHMEAHITHHQATMDKIETEIGMIR